MLICASCDDTPLSPVKTGNEVGIECRRCAIKIVGEQLAQIIKEYKCRECSSTFSPNFSDLGVLLYFNCSCGVLFDPETFINYMIGYYHIQPTNLDKKPSYPTDNSNQIHTTKLNYNQNPTIKQNRNKCRFIHGKTTKHSHPYGSKTIQKRVNTIGIHQPESKSQFNQ